MKGRSVVGLLIAALIFSVAPAWAQQPTFAMLGVNGCSGATPYGNAQWCFDSDTTTNPGLWYNNAGTFTLVAGGGGGGLNPAFNSVILNGSTSGALTLKAAATTTSYTLTFKSAVPAQGDILDFSNGTGGVSSLVDVAVGQVLTSGGVGAVAAYSATPSVTSLTATGTGDLEINASQGGHISSQIGAGTIPTCGTGTVTAISTDNAFRVTGATSPATVTFHTAFAAQPVCTCNDETSALGACKAVPNSNGATVVITTTGTDTFDGICIGH